MVLFIAICPSCGRQTKLAANQPCSNLLKNKTVCGFSLPGQYACANGDFRAKYEKHTNPPPSGWSGGPWSWAASGDYPYNQAFVLASGSLYYHPLSGYLGLATPLLSGRVANVFYPESGTIEHGLSILMLLNSKLTKLHHHYGYHEVSGLVHIADGPDLTIAISGLAMSGKSQKVYDVYQSGKLICTLDPMSGLVKY